MVYQLRSRDSPQKKFCQCTECGLQFFSDKEVQKHVKSVHSARSRHFCKECGIRFSRKSQKQAHKKQFHSLCCFACRKIFYSKRVFECHEKNHLYNSENSIKPIDNFRIKVEPTSEGNSIASVSKNRIEVNVGASASKVLNGIVPAGEKPKDDSGNSVIPKLEAGSSGVDIMANVRWCSSCGTNFLLPKVKFREHYAKCKEYYRKIALEKYNAKIAADSALAAASPKERSIDELSKQPVTTSHQELVEPQPTVPTSVVATNSKKRPSKPKKSKVQKKPIQNSTANNNVPAKTIEPLYNVSTILSSLSNGNQISAISSTTAVATNGNKRPSKPKKSKVQKEPIQNSTVNNVNAQIIESLSTVSASSSLSNGSQISVKSSNAAGSNDKKRSSNPIVVATKFPKKIQKESFHNTVANTVPVQIIEPNSNVSATSSSLSNQIKDISSNATVATNGNKRPSKPKKVQKEPILNPASNNVSAQTIESLSNVSATSSSLSNGNQISVKSSNAAGSNDKKRSSNPMVVATKFSKKRKVQKESFHNPVANTVPVQTIEPHPNVSVTSSSLSNGNQIKDISSNATNGKKRSSSPILATKNQKAQNETFQNPVANTHARPNVSSSPNSIGNEISAISLPIPSPSSSQLSNRMNTSLTRETVKQRTYLCSHCSFSISNMQVMMTHFGRMHPSQVVEFTELIMSKFKMEDNN